ncbi:MAG: hypothetical protein HY700_07970 [Gemmatimonadetes bacterium]|nr:hypothetical protein [Gemmatimonadota bacterium]
MSRASLEYLKKLAKERLREMRRTDPKAQLAAAQRDIAREQGFPSWRALKAELDRRNASPLAFYGQREFGIRDPNGVELMFSQPVEPPA